MRSWRDRSVTGGAFATLTRPLEGDVSPVPKIGAVTAARARKWCNHTESLRRTPRHDVRIIPAVATHTYTYTAHYTKERAAPLITV